MTDKDVSLLISFQRSTENHSVPTEGGKEKEAEIGDQCLLISLIVLEAEDGDFNMGALKIC